MQVWWALITAAACWMVADLVESARWSSTYGAVAGAAVLRPHGRALPGGRDGTTSRSGWTRAAASAASTR